MKHVLALSVVLGLSLSLTSCSSTKKAAQTAEPVAAVDQSTAGAKTFELNGDSDSNKAGALETIHFAFNSSVISKENQGILDGNAKFLKDNSKVTIQVEGHCDERGSVQYNLALGERRAKAVKSYIAALGIASDRISVVSYGKERPLVQGSDEESWAKNRRANFVVTSK